VLPALRHKVLVEFSGRRVPYPTDRTTIHLIEDEARSAPDRPALLWDDVALSYGECDRLAGAWAAVLRDRGVQRGTFVPVVTGGGPGLAIAILAAMKLGAPFVPIDDGWPEQRIQDGVAALHPKLVICTGQAAPALLPSVPVLHIDGTNPPARPHHVVHAIPTVDDLIYGFFTSGSTGTPKCALNHHLGLLNRFLTMTRRFGSGDDVVLQNSRHVFDSSIWQLLWPLTKGSCVVLPRRDGILDLTRTIDEIARHRVTMTDFVPSVFNTLVRLIVADPSLVSQLSSLRHLLIGGEEMNPRAVRLFRTLLPGVIITNTYGPTEASIGSIFHAVSNADAESIPIGKAIDNTYAVLLDDDGELVAPGEQGEIYLGGDCVGTGYLGDPRMTAAAFVPNAFPEIPGSRLYRTGDFAWHRDDGLLMFAGRRDNQVKLGGVRIELLEVENAIATHPCVAEAKAVVCGEGDRRALVCCVVLQRPLTPEALAEHAESVLPADWLPRSFYQLERMPLTPNGKLDRRELARLAASPASPCEARHEATLSETEQTIAELWRETLDDAGGDLGPEADFYAAGGTSLSLQLLAVRLRRTFAVRIPLRELADATTIREQAALVGCGARAVDRSASDARMFDDIARAATISAAPHPKPLGEPRDILLTGATGFVGLHLLAELLSRTAATVYCLVRADDVDQGRGRLAQALATLRRPYDPSRVVVIAGDLSLPSFGLSDGSWTELAGVIDTVVHCGAQVNLLLGYTALRVPNTLGTAEILRLAVARRAKRLHHISTVGVFGPSCTEDTFSLQHEEDGLPDNLPDGGYGRSKWAAEKILLDARERGIPSTVYRLGEVMPHSRSGRGNPHSLLHRLLRACLLLGLRVRTEAITDWTPVDRVAELLVAAVGADLTNETLHPLCSCAVRLDSLLAEVAPLRDVEYFTFHAAVKARAAHGSPELSALLSVLPEPSMANGDALLQLFSDSSARFSTKRAVALANCYGLNWGPLSENAQLNYVRVLTADAAGEGRETSASTRSA
jgi:amino acid adenylation domain-containing protein/thioester reductase-like protein